MVYNIGRTLRHRLRGTSNGYDEGKDCIADILHSIMTKPEGELEPKLLKIRDLINEGKVREVKAIEQIPTKGKPLHEEMPCGVCDGDLRYSSGQFISLAVGVLLIVQEIWGWRCETPGCLAGLILLPEVREALEREIRKTPAKSIE